MPRIVACVVRALLIRSLPIRGLRTSIMSPFPPTCSWSTREVLFVESLLSAFTTGSQGKPRTVQPTLALRFRILLRPAVVHFPAIRLLGVSRLSLHRKQLSPAAACGALNSRKHVHCAGVHTPRPSPKHIYTLVSVWGSRGIQYDLQHVGVCRVSGPCTPSTGRLVRVRGANPRHWHHIPVPRLGNHI